MSAISLNDAPITNRKKNDISITRKIGNMLGRVFTPSKMPIEGLCFIDSECWPLPNHSRYGCEYGLHIGNDFSCRLKDSNEKPFVANPKDFYVPIFIWRKDPAKENGLILRVIEYVLRKIFFFLGSGKEFEEGPIWMERGTHNELPSSMFPEPKENDVITFYHEECYDFRDGNYRYRKYILTLNQKQKNHINAKSYEDARGRPDLSQKSMLFEKVFSALKQRAKERKIGWAVKFYRREPFSKESWDFRRLTDEVGYSISPSIKIFDYQEKAIRPIYNDDSIFFQDAIKHNFEIKPIKIDSEGDAIAFDFLRVGQYHSIKCFIDKGVLILAFGCLEQLSKIEAETRMGSSERSSRIQRSYVFRYNLNLKNKFIPDSLKINLEKENILKCTIGITKHIVEPSAYL